MRKQRPELCWPQCRQLLRNVGYEHLCRGHQSVGALHWQKDILHTSPCFIMFHHVSTDRMGKLLSPSKRHGVGMSGSLKLVLSLVQRGRGGRGSCTEQSARQGHLIRKAVQISAIKCPMHFCAHVDLALFCFDPLSPPELILHVLQVWNFGTWRLCFPATCNEQWPGRPFLSLEGAGAVMSCTL